MRSPTLDLDTGPAAPRRPLLLVRDEPPDVAARRACCCRCFDVLQVVIVRPSHLETPWTSVQFASFRKYSTVELVQRCASIATLIHCIGRSHPMRRALRSLGIVSLSFVLAGMST